MANFRIPDEHHWENQWVVQKLAHDFILEDVWEYPIRFCEPEGDSLYAFRKHAVQPMIKSLLTSPTVSGSLFRLRKVIGCIFGIDRHVNKLPIPGCKESSLYARMNGEEKHRHNPAMSIDIESDNYLSFHSVYAFTDETLDELSNSTEHSLMHYAWIANTDGTHKVQMAVYVKHRNTAGKVYMELIKPFRHNIVYPYLFDEAIKKWNVYKAGVHADKR